MSKLHLLTEEQAISNKAWQLFNSELNNGLVWDDAKVDAELGAEKLRSDFDSSFEGYENDPDKNDMVYDKAMKQFDNLVNNIRAI